MVCRTGERFRGRWGSPAMYPLEGGSIGLQIGGQATDLVLLVMNERGADSILSEGSTLRPDDDATQDVYGRKLTAREIVIGGKVGVPESSRHLVRVLDKNSPRNESRKESARK
jgi:lipid-binding SYLF domain-containing protein